MTSETLAEILVRHQATKFEPVGACIYCGATDTPLSDEHIIPFAFNGSLILPKASCSACADITKRFEQTVGRSMYGLVRSKLRYRTRRPKDRPGSFRAKVRNENGDLELLEIPLQDFPIACLVPVLPAPGILTGEPLSETNPPMEVTLVGDPEEVRNLLLKLGANAEVALSQMFHWGDFSRLLAKIAHGYLVATLGLEGYEALLPPLITGQSAHLSHFVGGTGVAGTITMLAPHISLEVRPIEQDLYLAAHIHLLSGIAAPPYYVIAGRVTDPTLLDDKSSPIPKAATA